MAVEVTPFFVKFPEKGGRPGHIDVSGVAVLVAGLVDCRAGVRVTIRQRPNLYRERMFYPKSMMEVYARNPYILFKFRRLTDNMKHFLPIRRSTRRISYA